MGVFAAGFAVLVAGVAAFANMSSNEVVVDAKVERSCHREVKRRAPNGHRDLHTFGYRVDTDNVGVLSGSVRSAYADSDWAPLSWTCRVHPQSGRILTVEFDIQTSGSRLKAAAQNF